MELEQLRDIIQLLKEEGLTEITICDGDQRVTVRREGHGSVVVSPPPAAAGEAPSTASELPENVFELSAPLVGTFYRRPTPDDPPFISVGDIVQPGDTVCIVEAMKVMNEIHAEEPGRVRQVLLDEGALVEFGQALITFERL